MGDHLQQFPHFPRMSDAIAAVLQFEMSKLGLIETAPGPSRCSTPTYNSFNSVISLTLVTWDYIAGIIENRRTGHQGGLAGIGFQGNSHLLAPLQGQRVPEREKPLAHQIGHVAPNYILRFYPYALKGLVDSQGVAFPVTDKDRQKRIQTQPPVPFACGPRHVQAALQFH